MTFEEYLNIAANHGTIDFSVRCQNYTLGRPNTDPATTEFYIYPQGKNGKTLTFKVEENNLTLISETGEFEE